MAPVFKLYAPDGRAACEVMRIMLVIRGKLDMLDDVRYPIDMSKWKDEGMEAAMPAFKEDKAAGKLVANMNHLPLLEVDGVSIGQGSAMERLVAKRLDLYGANDIEAALIDQTSENLADIKKDYQVAKKEGEEKLAEWFKMKLPEWLGKFEPTLTGNGFAVGDCLSQADVKIYQFALEYFDNKEVVIEAVKAFPKLATSVEKVVTFPSVVEYLANRKLTTF